MDENKFEEVKEETVNLDEDIECFERNTIDDVVSDVKQAFVDVKIGVEEAINELLSKFDAIDLDKAALENYLDQFKTTVNNYVIKVSDAIKNIADDPKTNEILMRTKEAYRKVSDSVSTYVTSAYNKAMENDTVKKTVNVVTDKVKDAAEFASGKYNEFTHDPKVREVVVNAKDTVLNTYTKVLNTVKDVLKPDDEPIENTEDNKEE